MAVEGVAVGVKLETMDFLEHMYTPVSQHNCRNMDKKHQKTPCSQYLLYREKKTRLWFQMFFISPLLGSFK